MKEKKLFTMAGFVYSNTLRLFNFFKYFLQGYFKEAVLQAVLSATRRSLAGLAEAAGCTGEVVRAFTPASARGDGESDCSSPSPRAAYANYFR